MLPVGDGSEHLHWWFLARPRASAAEDEPRGDLGRRPPPAGDPRENLEAVAKALG